MIKNADTEQWKVQSSAAQDDCRREENKDVMACILGASRGICRWAPSTAC